MLLYLFENLPMNLSLNATIFSFELAPWMGPRITLYCGWPFQVASN